VGVKKMRTEEEEEEKRGKGRGGGYMQRICVGSLVCCVYDIF